jgi:hypothetical protein
MINNSIFTTIAYTLCIFGISITGCLYFQSQIIRLKKSLASMISNPELYKSERKEYLKTQRGYNKEWSESTDMSYISAKFQ